MVSTQRVRHLVVGPGQGRWGRKVQKSIENQHATFLKKLQAPKGRHSTYLLIQEWISPVSIENLETYDKTWKSWTFEKY